MVQGGRWEGGSGLGTRVYPWRIHVDVWQTNTIKKERKKKERKKGRLEVIDLPYRKGKEQDTSKSQVYIS